MWFACVMIFCLPLFEFGLIVWWCFVSMCIWFDCVMIFCLHMHLVWLCDDILSRCAFGLLVWWYFVSLCLLLVWLCDDILFPCAFGLLVVFLCIYQPWSLLCCQCCDIDYFLLVFKKSISLIKNISSILLTFSQYMICQYRQWIVRSNFNFLLFMTFWQF